jgi:hypothetical protein
MKKCGPCFWKIARQSVFGVTLVSLLAFSLLKVAKGQNTFVKTMSVTPNTRIASSDFTAICFRYPKQLNGLLSLKAGEKTIQLKPGEHALASDTVFLSQLMAFDVSQNSFALFSDTLFSGTITAFLFNPPQLAISPQPQKANESCDEPPMLMQGEWRQGLPDPDYDRIPNHANNLIIHHSATDNDLTDYTALVRSIYLYHTEVNGWSDIGYNYLVAPNGQIYAGRDPGAQLAQDDVLGAHFCASNTGTMGICVLGNYELIAPSTEAVAALLDLLAWKTAKDTMNPLAFVPHPLNSELGVIAGHRDGCATSCPGIHLYEEIPQIKSEVVELLHGCGLFPGTEEHTANLSNIRMFPNPLNTQSINFHSDNESIVKVVAYNMLGHEYKLFESSGNTQDRRINVHISLQPAVYLIRIETRENHYLSKLLVIE